MILSAFSILTTSSTFVVGIAADADEASQLAQDCLRKCRAGRVNCSTYSRSKGDDATTAARAAIKTGTRRLVGLVEDDKEFAGLKAPTSPKDKAIVAVAVSAELLRMDDKLAALVKTPTAPEDAPAEPTSGGQGE